ncbi:Thioredoxin domain-containing protein [Pyrolobus fumarii 1A]|uniref:Thioredoxin domain-containing protein n=1 Tax=Pyrolobus fumarii (strain DSM 11204 / 1A) TaxID=694429 RepID=G0EF32_PYRF1|nr:Thioredoxin domain-containing protein [Pyrolobus fumarii 1A]
MGLLRLTSKSELDRVIRGSRFALVVFTGLACPACEMYKPVLEKLAELVGKDMPVVEYVVDYDPEPALELGIMGTPTTVVYVDGKPVEGFVGAVDLPDLLEFLAKVASKSDKQLAEKLEKLAEKVKPLYGGLYW